MGRLELKSEPVSHLHLQCAENWWKHPPGRNKSLVSDLKGDTGFELGREKQQEMMLYREDPGGIVATVNATWRTGQLSRE